MTAPPRRRGGPLVTLAVLIGGWAVARAVLWEAPFGEPSGGFRFAEPAQAAGFAEASPAAVTRHEVSRAGANGSPLGVSSLAGWRVPLSAGPPAPTVRPASRLAFRAQATPATMLARPQKSIQAASPPGLPVPATHAFGVSRPASNRRPAPDVPYSRAPAASALTPRPSRSLLSQPAAPLLSQARSRWSADGWLLWRRGSGSIAAAGRASYGGSQAGAVLRYDLAPASERAPAAYLRVSRALAFKEGEAALGVSARPLAAVPVRLLAEARVQRAGETRLRPAVSLVTELPPLQLPLNAEAEIYAQAGYLGGRGGTAFVDAQFTAERPAWRAGAAALHVGAGVWAGGQEGAGRLDLGPRATLRLGLDGASSRLALDWRVRVAGGAAPGSGPALTFSAGF